ncbi:hypothetical protein U0070_014084 [Myodes glareolus]|uniref:Uncharacterized protein n=1 Tax=Myodes glareolus TaxID=447135 RepID=A0AAW0HBG8_MYOGA
MAADRRPKGATLDLRRRLLRYRVRAWKARKPQVLDFPASLSLGFLEAAVGHPLAPGRPLPRGAGFAPGNCLQEETGLARGGQPGHRQG